MPSWSAVIVLGVLASCAVVVAGGKSDLQSADPVATSYPLRFCAPGHRFRVTVVVVG